MAALAWGGGPTTTTTTAKKKAVARKRVTASSAATSHGNTVVARKPPSGRPASGPATAAARRGKKTPARPTTTWRNRQVSPTSDRYREIQDALAAKGYLKTEEVTGAWDQTSAEALKSFQAEQNLGTTGKINSLSLIALGLGPRHDSAAVRMPGGGGGAEQPEIAVPNEH